MLRRQSERKTAVHGNSPETAVGMFDYTPQTPDEIRAHFSPVPKLIRETSEGSLRTLISPEDCELFSAYELRVDGNWELDNPDSCGIGIVTEGTLDFDGIRLRAGENFFLPYECKKLPVRGKGKIILIRPPAA